MCGHITAFNIWAWLVSCTQVVVGFGRTKSVLNVTEFLTAN